jgi:hypothetical protein
MLDRRPGAPSIPSASDQNLIIRAARKLPEKTIMH